MKTRPINFSSPMVRAILNGEKTQTRQVIKPQPPDMFNLEKNGCHPAWRGKIVTNPEKRPNGEWYGHGAKCPFGQPGDTLWVKEAFRISTANDCDHLDDCGCKSGSTIYRADNDDESTWRSPIHMPMRASRITLEIVGVRVERLQDITEADAFADAGSASGCAGCAVKGEIAICAFSAVWDDIYAKKGHGWDANPWVWVIDFTHESRHLSC